MSFIGMAEKLLRSALDGANGIGGGRPNWTRKGLAAPVGRCHELVGSSVHVSLQ